MRPDSCTGKIKWRGCACVCNMVLRGHPLRSLSWSLSLNSHQLLMTDFDPFHIGRFSFILLLPPIFLIVYPFKFFQRFITRCRIDSTAVRTFVEAFQGSYKDGTNGTRDCRYFASTYFLLRLISFCSMSATSDLVLLRLIEVVTLILFIVSIAMLHPYKKRQHTLIDLFILTVLSLVLSLAFYNAAVPNGSFVINAFLMLCTMVPVFFMTGLVIRHLVRQSKNKWKKNYSVSRSREEERLLDASDQLPDRINNPDKYHRSININ